MHSFVCKELCWPDLRQDCCKMLQHVANEQRKKYDFNFSIGNKKKTRLSESRDLFFGKHFLGCGVSFVQKTYPKHFGMLSETCCSHSWEILSPNPLPPHPLLPRADVEQVAMIMSQSVCDLGSAKYLWIQHHCEPVAHDSKTLLQNMFQQEPTKSMQRSCTIYNLWDAVTIFILQHGLSPLETHDTKYQYMYTCIHVYMYTCIHVYMYTCMYVCMYVCMYLCMYVCMYVCINLM